MEGLKESVPGKKTSQSSFSSSELTQICQEQTSAFIVFSVSFVCCLLKGVHMVFASKRSVNTCAK